MGGSAVGGGVGAPAQLVAVGAGSEGVRWAEARTRVQWAAMGGGGVAGARMRAATKTKTMAKTKTKKVSFLAVAEVRPAGTPTHEQAPGV